MARLLGPERERATLALTTSVGAGRPGESHHDRVPRRLGPPLNRFERLVDEMG